MPMVPTATHVLMYDICLMSFWIHKTHQRIILYLDPCFGKDESREQAKIGDCPKYTLMKLMPREKSNNNNRLQKMCSIIYRIKLPVLVVNA
jgi:hypothetical protein